ncbi:hypothetical protein [Cohnella panacarvi]|nr:hypothetical protein [Cohnella panacarvi]
MSDARSLLGRTSWAIKEDEIDRLCEQVKSVVPQPNHPKCLYGGGTS